mgnify:CR=1 FL=1
MTAGLVRLWNRRVGDSDTVYHLGDFAMGQKALWPEYRRQLNGRIIFTLGNHDKPLEKFEAALLPGDSHCQETTLWLGGLCLSLAHIPPKYTEYRRQDGLLVRPDSTVSASLHDIYLCGHIHKQWKADVDRRCINVGVDQWRYQPITLDEIKEAATWL